MRLAILYYLQRRVDGTVNLPLSFDKLFGLIYLRMMVLSVAFSMHIWL